MIVVLGSFDGFHRGHALLCQRARELARPLNMEWGAITFDPHPGLFMNMMDTTLFTLRERELIRIFLEIPRIIALKFDDELAHFSPGDFWEFLRENVSVDGVVVGSDFRFGYRRTGDAALLADYCRGADVDFISVDILEHLGAKISSSAIREHVKAGECELAAKELGYPYFLWAEVAHGLGRGKDLGYPTANLSVSPRSRKLVPPDGVYAAAVLADGQWKAGALSIGKNPTFGDVSEVQIELFVLDYEGDLYGASLPVFFLSRLRPQVRFKDAEQLILQIDADVRRAKAAFRSSMAAHSADWYAKFMVGYAEVLAKLGYAMPGGS